MQYNSDGRLEETCEPHNEVENRTATLIISKISFTISTDDRRISLTTHNLRTSTSPQKINRTRGAYVEKLKISIVLKYYGFKNITLFENENNTIHNYYICIVIFKRNYLYF